MNLQRVVMFGVVFLGVPLFLATPDQAFGQRPRSAIERRLHPGRGFWENERASREIRHAVDRSRGLYDYGRFAEKVEPDVAKAESERLSGNITAAQNELNRLRKEFANDAEVLKALKTIEAHLAAAASTHKTLHDECCKDSVDGSKAAKCCIEITAELEKALAEHDALMKKLDLRSENEKRDQE